MIRLVVAIWTLDAARLRVRDAQVEWKCRADFQEVGTANRLLSYAGVVFVCAQKT
jgi:hypothetical protein